jgi:hypothetical protein
LPEETSSERNKARLIFRRKQLTYKEYRYMKVKLMAVLLITISAGTLVMTTASSNNHKDLSKGATTAIKPLPQDPQGTIDGSTQPDMISDRVAYSLLLRFLSGRHTEAEKNRARSYLRMIFGCKDCGTKKETAEQKAATQAEVEAFFSIASDFEEHVGAFDRQAREIKGRSGKQLDAIAKNQLGNLQKQKNAFVDALVASLPSRLGASGVGKLRQYLKEEFKQKIKIGPAPGQLKKAAVAGPTA